MELVNKVLQGYVNGELKDIAPSTKQDNVFLQNDPTKTIDDYIQYKVGDTITTTDAGFNPNTAIGGTWTKQTAGVGFFYAQKLNLDPSATTPNPHNCQYVISNGMCVVTLDQITTPGASITTIATGMPPAAMRVFYAANNGAQAVINAGDTKMLSIQSTGFSAEVFTIAYPIANGSVGYGERMYVWTKTA